MINKIMNDLGWQVVAITKLEKLTHKQRKKAIEAVNDVLNAIKKLKDISK